MESVEVVGWLMGGVYRGGGPVRSAGSGGRGYYGRSMSRETVITGLGAVTALGIGAEALWRGLCEGRSELRPIEAFDAREFACRLAGEVRGYAARDFVPKSYRKAVKVMARDIELAVGAARCAVEDAGIVTRGTLNGDGDGSTEATFAEDRIGCQIGAGFIACDAPELAMAQATAQDATGAFSLGTWGKTGMGNLSPLWLLKYLPNMLACHVTIIHGAKGPSNTITCCEASGLLSIGESRRVIERGDGDICFSGGAESKINPLGFLRMEYTGRLADTGDSTDGAGVCRPFDAGSHGSILGEGAGIVLIESAATATKRGARVHARVAGFGAAQSIDDDAPGTGLAMAVEAALAEAGMDAGEIDLIVPHASGCLRCDADEAAGLERVFGARLGSIETITLSPHLGDTLAGAGGLAVCAAATALREQVLPSRLAGGSASVNAGARSAGPATLRSALVCTNALGGQNAALVLRAP